MKAYLTVAQAESILPDKDFIHTFYDGPCLVGADWERKDILDKLKKSDKLELTGPAARGMGHGLCAYDNKTKFQSQILFIETDEEKLMTLEEQLKAGKVENEAPIEAGRPEKPAGRINAICEEILALDEKDFGEVEVVIHHQKNYCSPLKYATQAWQHELAEYNEKVLTKIKELQELIKSGAEIKAP